MYERDILYSNPSYSRNDCSCIDEHGKGRVMVTESLVNILLGVGVNVKYPHNVQTPDRLNSTRERANQVAYIKVQSVDEYNSSVRDRIHALLD